MWAKKQRKDQKKVQDVIEDLIHWTLELSYNPEKLDPEEVKQEYSYWFNRLNNAGLDMRFKRMPRAPPDATALKEEIITRLETSSHTSVESRLDKMRARKEAQTIKLMRPLLKLTLKPRSKGNA